MATGKRFYWMKLKTSFMASDAVDYIMSQPNGAEYIVLYQMLCLKTINTGGRFATTIGEVIIPYDIPKIQRDLKWFSADTIRVALELFKAFGLVYEDAGGTLVLADHENLVGSETDWAAQKRAQQQKQIRQEEPACRSTPGSGNEAETGVENFHTEIRVKSSELELDTKSLDTKKKTLSYERAKEESGAGSCDPACQAQSARRVVESWNALGLSTVSKVTQDTLRGKLLHARLTEHGEDKLLQAIENVRSSDFLRGQNSTGWVITFDWMLKPNNFLKVLDGYYNNRASPGASGRAAQQRASPPKDDLDKVERMLSQMQGGGAVNAGYAGH